MKMGTMSHGSKQLVVSGATLFLLGLSQGAAVPYFFNPRMALSAHLTAVQSATAIMVAGALWGWTHLSAQWNRIGRWAVIVGMYGLWLALTLSAETGASDSLPIAGEGYHAGEAMETAVSVAVVGSSVVMFAGWAIFTIGLVRKRGR
jgi:(hydroxyamino)benzene mutase